MKQGIVVCTWSGGQPWADLCLDSLKSLYDKYPIYVVVNDILNADPKWINSLWSSFSIIGINKDEREPGGLRQVLTETNLNEFWFLQDTVEITDTDFIEESFQEYSGYSVSYMRTFAQFYLAKWQRSVLESIDISIPKNKLEAIKYENTISNAYQEAMLDKRFAVVDPKMGYGNLRSNYIDTLFGEERFAVVGKNLIKRVSIVKENFRKDNSSLDNPEYLSEEEVKQWRKVWRVMTYNNTGV
jgi:hypothetical protein